jgi:excisionase family DNA binding protein
MALKTIDEIAEKSRLARSTLYKLTSTRAIPFLKIGARVLFEEEKVDEWLAAHRVEPTEVAGRVG